MKKFMLSAVVCCFAVLAFSQAPQKNGTIYIKHPYIDAIKSSNTAYLKKDHATYEKIYADTAKFWISGMEKEVSIKEAYKMWDADFENFENIQIKEVGYPDYLEYVKDNMKVVQSWGTWSGKSKKTGEIVKVDFVQFDTFNKAGKIIFEWIYGDFSKLANQ